MPRRGAKTEPDLFTLPERKTQPAPLPSRPVLLPDDLVCSLRLLADAELERLQAAVVNEVARRGPPTPPLGRASDPSDERERRVRTAAAPKPRNSPSVPVAPAVADSGLGLAQQVRCPKRSRAGAWAGCDRRSLSEDRTFARRTSGEVIARSPEGRRPVHARRSSARLTRRCSREAVPRKARSGRTCTPTPCHCPAPDKKHDHGADQGADQPCTLAETSQPSV